MENGWKFREQYIMHQVLQGGPLPRRDAEVMTSYGVMKSWLSESVVSEAPRSYANIGPMAGDLSDVLLGCLGRAWGRSGG